MSGDQANCNMGAQPPKEVQFLTNYFTSLYRKEIMEKPNQFEHHMNMIQHLEAVDKQVAYLTQLVFSLRQNISQRLVEKNNSRQHKYPPVRNLER